MTDIDTENMQDIKEMGTATAAIDMRAGDIQCMTIIGQIEGHTLAPSNTKTTKYEHIIPVLMAIEQDDAVRGIIFAINTIGGDVEAGLAIAEVISTLSKPTVSLVLGGGHSIGVPLAVAADYSFIAPSATMTIHPIRMNGLVIGVAQTYDYFQKVQERVLEFVTHHSRIGHDALQRLMLATGEIANDVGTILFGAQAVECGLIDDCGGVSAAYAKLRDLIDQREAVAGQRP